MTLDVYTDTELREELHRREVAKKARPLVRVAPTKLVNNMLEVATALEVAVGQVEAKEVLPKNWDAYVFQAVVEAVYGKAFWDWYRRYNK